MKSQVVIFARMLIDYLQTYFVILGYLVNILVFSINFPFPKSSNNLELDFKILLSEDKGTVLSSLVNMLVKLSVYSNEKLTIT